MHIQVTTPDTDHLKLKAALLIYQSNGGSGRGRTLITAHNIQEDRARRPQLGPGHLLDPGELATSLADEGAKTSYWIADNVLVMGYDHLAWWTPAQRRPLFFNIDEMKAATGRPVPHPPLLWIARRSRLSVYALRDNRRPTLDSKTYRAPYPNMHDDHQMCIGSVPMPDYAVPTAIRQYESAFFDSYFSSSISTAPRVRAKGGLLKFWGHLAARKVKTFPLDRLLPVGTIRKIFDEA